MEEKTQPVRCALQTVIVDWIAPYCGDGIIDANDEECDEGEQGNSNCTVTCLDLCSDGAQTFDIGETDTDWGDFCGPCRAGRRCRWYRL